MSDIWTMFWKETKGSVLQGGRTAAIRTLLAIGILGLLLPWQFGQSWLALSPAALLLILYMPFLFTSMSVGDAIVGERERHTLAWRRCWPAVSVTGLFCSARLW